MGPSHLEVSEWRPEFSSFIRSMWSRAFREWDDGMAKRGASNEDRATYLGDLKSRKAREFGLSADELQEILEATD